MGEVPWRRYPPWPVREAAGRKCPSQRAYCRSARPDDRYGADALRFTWRRGKAGPRHQLDEKRVEGYATSPPNMEGGGFSRAMESARVRVIAAPQEDWRSTADHREVVETLAKLDKAIADLRYDEMADAIYRSPGALLRLVCRAGEGCVGRRNCAPSRRGRSTNLVMLHPSCRS